MTKSAHGHTRDLARALKQQAAATATQEVRGTPSRRAVVASVGTDGTVTTTDGITALRLGNYANPVVGDVVALAGSASGSWVALDRLAAADGALFKYKTADLGRTTTNFFDDGALTIAQIAPAATYRVSCHVSVIATDVASDINIGFTVPTGSDGMWSGFGQPAAMTTDTGTLRTLDRTWAQTLILGAITGTGDVKRCEGVLITGAAGGPFAFRWCRSGASGTTTVRAGSWLELRRVG